MNFEIKNGIAILTTETGRVFKRGFYPENGDTEEAVKAHMISLLPKAKKSKVRHVLVNADGTETELGKVKRNA
jgi:hypothetical protein